MGDGLGFTVNVSHGTEEESVDGVQTSSEANSSRIVVLQGTEWAVPAILRQARVGSMNDRAVIHIVLCAQGSRTLF